MTDLSDYTISFHGISKIRAAKARSYLRNRGILCSYTKDWEMFEVHVIKQGREITLKIAEKALGINFTV